MRLLQRTRPHRHRAIAEVAALPAEWVRLGPSLQDQLHALIGPFPGLLRVEVIGQRLVRRPAQQPDDQTPVRHGIEHRQFLGEAHRIAVRNDRAEQGDFDLMDARRDIGGGDLRRRGQDARRIVVLRQADPIEAEFFREGDPLDHPLKDPCALAGVIGGGGHRPDCRHVRRRLIAAGFEIRDFHDDTLRRISRSGCIRCPREPPSIWDHGGTFAR